MQQPQSVFQRPEDAAAHMWQYKDSYSSLFNLLWAKKTEKKIISQGSRHTQAWFSLFQLASVVYSPTALRERACNTRTLTGSHTSESFKLPKKKKTKKKTLVITAFLHLAKSTFNFFFSHCELSGMNQPETWTIISRRLYITWLTLVSASDFQDEKKTHRKLATEISFWTDWRCETDAESHLTWLSATPLF